MANRYIRHGATYCGDGTTSALATVNGGPGAWNDIAVFESTIAPAYGTLPAGTDVYVRTKDEAGNDIAIPIAATQFEFGSTAATELLPVSWFFDAGEVWPGVSGSVTYTITYNAGNVRHVAFNNVICSVRNLFFIGVANINGFGVTLRPGYTRNITVDQSLATNSNGVRPHGGTHENFFVRATNSNSAVLGGPGDAAMVDTVTWINPTIELCRALSATYALFRVNTYNRGGTVNVFGGRVFGAFAVDNVLVCAMDSSGGIINLVGFQYPRGMKLNGTVPAKTHVYCAIGADGKNSSEFCNFYYSYTTRLDSYYPTLNAILEDGAPWAYALYPFNVSKAYPASVTTVKKYNSAEATRTVTVNFLWPDSVTMASLSKSNAWIVVQYTSSAGVICSESSFSSLGGSIAESSALWTSLTYGPTLFRKHALSLTTLNAVALNSNITVTFQCSARSGAATDILIVDPDPVVV